MVYAADGLTPADVFTAIANLVTKSLIAADISGEVSSYRLLDTTRAYALEKLAVSGEIDRVRRLHAEAIRDLFRQANAEVATGATDEWREKYGPQVGNLRSALDWAFSPGGDATLGISIAAAATNSWIALALLSECCYWGARAIAKLGTAERTHDNMVLRCGVGLALLLSKGPTPQAYDSLTEARALSESLDDTTCQLRAIYGLWLLAIRAAKFRESLAIGRQYAVLAETFWDGVATPMAGHMLGISRFCLGENASAAVDLEQASATSARSGDAIHLGVDLRPITLCYQALTYWVLGFVERSLQIGQQAIKEAHVANHRVSLCIVLGLFSSIVLVKIGALESAERCIDEITDIAERHSLVPYQALGLCAKGSLLVARGDSATADQLLDRGLAHMREVALSLYTTIFLSERASVLGSLGQIEKGLAEIEVAEFQATQSSALWCMPEVLRVKGELLVRHGGAKEAEVEQCFLQSLGWARRQKALSWELRASISLAHFWRDRDRAAEASELVSRVYRRFTEGFETTDLQKAKTLLDALA